MFNLFIGAANLLFVLITSSRPQLEKLCFATRGVGLSSAVLGADQWGRAEQRQRPAGNYTAAHTRSVGSSGVINGFR